MLIKFDNVSYIYKEGSPYETKAIEDINLEISKGEFIGIIGHTGCGKSTLVQHMNGLLRPTHGKVIVSGKAISKEEKADRLLRKRVGMVFQYPEDQLFEETIFADVAFAPRNYGCANAEIEERVREAIHDVGLEYNLLKDRSPFSLSGGQMRKVAIAGVLAARPEVLILDEPTAGLDPKGRDEILDKIKYLHEEKNLTIVLVSHNMDDIAAYAKRVLVMAKGKIVMDGPPKNIFQGRELLKEIGLGVPAVTELMYKLRENNIDVRTDIMTLEEAKKEILIWKNKVK